LGPPPPAGDLFLELEKALEEPLWTGRAPGNEDVHRDDPVHPLNHVVLILEIGRAHV